MLTWANVKPLVRKILAPAFAPLGFAPPARAMWRYRPEFVDVVWFEAARHGGAVALTYGATPRVRTVASPDPSECRFSVGPTIDLGADGELLLFRDDAETQTEAFRELAPQLTHTAQRWFSKFDTVESAIEALEMNALRGEAHVMHAAPGSPAYLQTMAELEAVRSRRTVVE